LSFDKPKKRFSQNFLIDKNIAEKIVSLLEIEESDVVLEIGAGRGALTGLIAKTGAQLFAFEIDRGLTGKLTEEFGNYRNVEILNNDFLKVNPEDYCQGGFKLIGNIPYDITSPLLEWVHKNRDAVKMAVITAQKELAARIAPSPGSKNWAPISILTQCFFDVRIVFDIRPAAFYPSPKVTSSTMVLKPGRRYAIKDWLFFEKVVRQAFHHRRKMLINNLDRFEEADKSMLHNIFEKLGFDEKVRAEQLSITDFIKLTDEFISNIS